MSLLTLPANLRATRPPFAASSSAGWAPQSPRRGAALAVLSLHGLVLLGLWHAGGHVVARLQQPVQLLQVRVLPVAPDNAPQAPARPAWVTAPPIALAPAPALGPLPTPEFTPTQALREQAPPPPPAPALLASPDAVAPRAAVAAAPPGPKPVPAGSLRYRTEPAVEVPRLSRRAGEQGRVLLRVVFDTEGRPRDIQLVRSSGFARLDAQAREAMQAARIAPYLEDGRAIEVVAQATLLYELD